MDAEIRVVSEIEYLQPGVGQNILCEIQMPSLVKAWSRSEYIDLPTDRNFSFLIMPFSFQY